MRFGHFDDAAREYVIARPDTPLPWINYLGSEEYFAIVSNTAGGYSFFRDPRLRRLTRYRYNNVPLDARGPVSLRPRRRHGRLLVAVVAADEERARPVQLPPRARLHGDRRRAARASTSRRCTSCPLGETLEFWRTRVANHRAARARLSLFSAVEFCLWDAWDDATNFQRNLSVGRGRGGGRRHLPQERVPRAPRPLRLLRLLRTTARDSTRNARRSSARTGAGTARSQSRRAAQATRSLTAGRRAAHTASSSCSSPASPARSSSCSATRRILATRSSTRPGSQTIDKRRVRPGDSTATATRLEVESAFVRLRDDWTGSARPVSRSSTPDEHVDRMVNVWNQYQCMVTFNLSRSASLFESGIGRGMGFRDSNQDLLGIRAPSPGAGTRADPRPRCDPASDRRRLPPVPAAHEARQRRDRLRLQRRPALADPRGGRVREGDGRPLDPPASRSRTTTSRASRRHSTSTRSARSATRSTGSGRTVCR